MSRCIYTYNNILGFDKSTVRSKVEHIFGVVKRLLRFRRTRYLGLQKQQKQQAKFNFIFALAKLYPADKKNFNQINYSVLAEKMRFSVDGALKLVL